jgi:hypothetical protein
MRMCNTMGTADWLVHLAYTFFFPSLTYRSDRIEMVPAQCSLKFPVSPLSCTYKFTLFPFSLFQNLAECPRTPFSGHGHTRRLFDECLATDTCRFCTPVFLLCAGDLLRSISISISRHGRTMSLTKKVISSL